jgi:transcriptional regulator with XRE-family HTH domain
MTNPLAQLLENSANSRREQVRARLRVSVTEGLLKCMEDQKISKQELATRIGVSRSAVTQALSTSRNLSLNTLADMADALALQPRIGFISMMARDRNFNERPITTVIELRGASHPTVAQVGTITSPTLMASFAIEKARSVGVGSGSLARVFK